MAWCLFDTKPLSEPMIVYYLLDPLGTNASDLWIKIQKNSYKKKNPQILSVNWQPFCPCHDVLMVEAVGGLDTLVYVLSDTQV